MWKIQPHDYIDKSFLIEGPLDIEIDYDDVHHPIVDVLAEEVVRVLNEHFVPPVVWRCQEPQNELEIPRPGSQYSWDTISCYETLLRASGPCPVCGGPTEPEEASL